MLQQGLQQFAGVAELADALASGASDRKVVWVQVPSPAPGRVPRHAFYALRRFSFAGFLPHLTLLLMEMTAKNGDTMLKKLLK